VTASGFGLRRLPLGACTEFVLDGTHGSPERTPTGIPVLSAANVKDGRLSYATDRFTSEKEYEAYRRRLETRSGDVLLTIVGTIGRAAVVDDVRPHVFQRSVAVLRPRNNVLDSRFLFHTLNTSDTTRQLASRTNQSAQAGIYLGALKEVTVPVPPLPEQRRIADILDKADAIRRKRKEAIALTEQLLRSAFLHMFGDPVTNPKGWPVCSLEDLCSDVVDCPHTTPKYTGEPKVHPCIRTSDLQFGFFDWSTTKYVDSVEYAERIARLRPEPGDVFYSREGERFGIAALLPNGVGACLGQRMMLLRANRTIASPAYVWGALNSAAVYSQAMAEVGGSTSPHVNVKAIRRFKVCRPPLPVQAEYSNVYANAVALRERHLRAAGEARELFSSLVQRAFSGELAS